MLFKIKEMTIEDEIFKSLYKRPNPKARNLYNNYNAEKPLDNVEMDLLFLPEDKKGYKYAFNLVDTASRYKWSVPLKTKNGKDIKNALEKVFSKDKPRQLTSDKGSEALNKDVKAWCSKHKVELKVIPTGHHLSLVENYNGHLARKIFAIQSYNEYNTGQVDKDWVDNLDSIVNEMNNTKNAFTKLKPRIAIKKDIISLSNDTKQSKSNDKDKTLFHKVGTIVRRLLERDEILDIQTLSIKSEKRRVTDPYWSWKLYIVSSVYKPEDGYWYHILRDYNTNDLYSESYNYWSLREIPKEWLNV